MALEKITGRCGKAVPIPGDDIDTDRIIPARFMKCVTFHGLGEYLFYDVRRNEDGSDKTHPLNEPKYQNASILISGSNFGCGSSREHAPQAIAKAGYTAVIAEGFAEIFFGNSTQLGIPCVSVSHGNRLKLSASVEKNPEQTLEIDLNKREILFKEGSLPFSIRESSRFALMEGKWDPLLDLLENEKETARLAEGLSYINL